MYISILINNILFPSFFKSYKKNKKNKKLNLLGINKITLARKKGNKDCSPREKQMMISLINDYSLFGATDNEMIKMLSIKLEKENNEKISETFFYSLKEVVKSIRGESEQWLDYCVNIII